MITASALDRVAECPVSEKLPRTFRDSSDGVKGSIRHAYLAAVPILGAEAALAQMKPEYREALALIDLSEETGLGAFLDRTKFLQEVTFAYEPATGKARVLGENLGRDYSSALPGEVVGTCDVVGLADDAVVIPDYKGPHALLEPREMRQLKFLALAACRALERTRAVSGVIRLREDGSHHFERVEFDEFDLDAFALELKDIVARVETAKPMETPTREGDWCRYCPSFDWCPAKTALVRTFAASPDKLTLAVEETTEEALALAYERACALEKVLERVLSSIRARAKQKAIPLAKGQVLGVVEVDEVNPEVAGMVLEAIHGPEVAAAAVKVEESVSKASIEQALRLHVLKTGMQIGKLKEEAFEAIRGAGGMTVGAQVRRRKAREGELSLPAPDTDLQQKLEASVAQAEPSTSTSEAAQKEGT